MPLYDCMLLLKPHVKKEALADLVAWVGKHVYGRKGVLTDIKSLGTVHLGYGIQKLVGRCYQGQLMQMTVVATPNINKELHYLNKEDTKFVLDSFSDDLWNDEPDAFQRLSLYNNEDLDESV
ncbi:hypothetical protein K2173_015730 [Erythroxylum novogranatense]|uniref:Uncharacterized protein n=1 Tax=Erythroxylum novogranatense TaxID=1862640 RepID=A0AAV8SEW0_9ROSI|nr:hypothetical protein K2173_015730 [Erythroxylum novogranatense]